MEKKNIFANICLALDGLLVASFSETMLGIVFGISPINYSKRMHLGVLSTIVFVGINRLMNNF